MSATASAAREEAVPTAARRYRAALRAERTKLVRRPLTWVLLGSGIVGIVAARYWLGYAHFRQARTGLIEESAPDHWMLAVLLPQDLVTQALADLPEFGAAVAMVLAILATAGEHQHRTLKLSLTQGPQRVEILAATTTALMAALAMAVAAAFVTAAGASTLIALVEGEPLAFPHRAHALRGFAYALLIVGAWAALGVLFATVLRGVGPSMGVALAHMFAVERVFGMAADAAAGVSGFAQYLVTPNVATLFVSLQDNTIVAGFDIPPWRAALTLACYTAGALGVSALVLRRRDVT